ncbi:S8 family serine peptidase [Hymenobacter sp. BT175]|uniref:S8 family serine peptidase n=1 Tax=Hymenobacter translucens TaxID=2886507 RepID=UPI001D0E138D|nr:S8 family serine peptidase [Hymenobacter translucens]MCC2546853.1 S8 family serine peptidase [Hymenobacter translucens]
MLRFRRAGFCYSFLTALTLVLATALTPARAQTAGRALPEGKIAPAVLRRIPIGSQLPRLCIQVRNRAAFETWARQHLPELTIAVVPGQSDLLQLTGLVAGELPVLSACPWVVFVDLPDRRAREERLVPGANLTVNRVAALHEQFPALTGQGMAVSIKERPFDPADPDLKGRVLNPTAIPGPATVHATTMASIVAGAANTGPNGRGVAWQASLASSDFARLLPDDAQPLLQAGISVQNHSYGVDIENFYGLESRAYDQQTIQVPTLLHVFSSGNAGRDASADGRYRGLAGAANLTGQFKQSKNTLSVGATDASGTVSLLSSRGPAYDGRIKPELVAYGDGGTSDAAALVSGASVLVQQAYGQPRAGTLPPAALVKAVLINSADDTGRPGPDFVAGFGQVDALGAVQTITENRFTNSTVATQATRAVPVSVPTGTYLLKATLVWHDAEAPAGAAQALLNDLDLELVNLASGQRWQPWALSSYPHPDSLALPARRRPDHLNNVEQVTITLPAAGAYELRVRGQSLMGASQAFSIAYELESGLTWVQPGKTSHFRPLETNILHWQWRGPATSARLEYQPVGRTGWELLSGSVNLSQQYYVWRVPDTLTLARVRLVAGSNVYHSDTFSIAPPLLTGFGYVCPDAVAPREALLHWNALPGVARYQVYHLRGLYLEPLLQTADTAVVLTQGQLGVRQYAVTPILQGRPLERSRTVDFIGNGIGCYIRSFVAREAATSLVRFDLTLGSVFRLRSATLEKLGPDGYQPVQTLQPVVELEMAFTDLNPASGPNTYRAHVLDVAGNSYYSQPETVQYVASDDVQVYPNPAPAGTALQVIQGEGGATQLQLYDLLGRLVRETSGEGQVKLLDTSGLKKGVYVLRARTASGQALQRRVVVL